MIIKRSDFRDANKLEYMPGTVEAELFRRILEEVRSFGPFTTEIFKHIWLNHLRKAESAINSLLRFGYRFPQERFEAACKRVVFYDLASPALVELVLLERLDTLPLDHSTDIYGQRLLF
jgi:hypothetical protein